MVHEVKDIDVKLSLNSAPLKLLLVGQQINPLKYCAKSSLNVSFRLSDLEDNFYELIP